MGTRRLESVLSHLFTILLHLGFAGLIIVGVLDSSFLFLPLGNDLLVVAMQPERARCPRRCSMP